MQKGLVYKSTGNWYLVKLSNKEFYEGRIRGVLKLENFNHSNPIAVGDWVHCEIEDDTNKLVNIVGIEERKNLVERAAIQNKNKTQILAANIDQTLLIVTAKNPIVPQGLIDRILLTNELFHIPSIVVFNKTDCYETEDWQAFQEFKDMYRNVGYSVYEISVTQRKGIESVGSILMNKKTLLFGQSGAGKTSLINLILNKNLPTKLVSPNTGKGMHTTTYAEMFDLNEQTQIIDTPGIKELGLVNIEASELGQYFPEFKPVLDQCKFNNCQHLNEPQCAVKTAVGVTIPIKRYESYLMMYESIQGLKKWRSRNE